MASPERPTWLLIFFVHEILSYTTEISEQIKEIENAGCGKDTVVYLLLDSVKKVKGVSNYTLSLKQLVQQGRRTHFVEVEGFVFQNSDRRCWATGFEFIFERIDAARKMIITLSHGAAFGINRDFDRTARPPSLELSGPETEIATSAAFFKTYKNSEFYLDGNDIKDLKAFFELRGGAFTNADVANGIIRKNGVTAGCRSLEILWIADLANAVKNLPGSPKIDILLMANCYMQSFDTGYILRECVEYLIAPQPGIPVMGYNLPNLMNSLNIRSLTTETIATNIIAGYIEKYPKGSIGRDWMALSANNLEGYEELFTVFEDIVNILMIRLSTIKQDLNDIRNNLLYVSIGSGVSNSNELMMIDLKLFVDKILEKFSNLPGISQIAQRFNRAFAKCISGSHIGLRFAENDRDNIYKYGVNGISLFFPLPEDYSRLSNFVLCAYFDRQVPSPFRKDSLWDEFLIAYYS